MSRFSRESFKTNYFHVITQGINKSYIFDKQEDIKYYIKLMYKLKEEHNIRIIAYCIMNNHTHMLVKVVNINELSKYMQRLNSAYAYYYNKKHNRVGYVFRDRYKSEGIYSERQFYTCIKYIYDNPVKAGICDRPEQYPYSNYRRYPVQKIDKNLTFIDIEEEKERELKDKIDELINQKRFSIKDLKKTDKNLEIMIKILKDKYNISLRKIAEELNISREKVRKLYKK